MAAELQDDRVPYQRVLRALGASLDDAGARMIAVVEVEDGLMVRYSADGVTRHFHLTHAEALSRDAERAGMRSRSRRPHTAGGPRYQDVLRALGDYLEQIPAYAILIDEGDWGFLVSYQQYSPTEGFLLHKVTLMLGPSDREFLLAAAREKRRPRRFPHFSTG